MKMAAVTNRAQIYEPLSLGRRETRLLTIDSSLDIAGRIQCHLRRAFLDQCSPDVALSYCWGNPTVTAPILLNDHEHQVTKNLASALHYIRGSLEPGVSIWIDALCINQADTGERNHQVQLMRDIFQSSNLVIAWLGHAEEHQYSVFKIFSRLARHPEDFPADWCPILTPAVIDILENPRFRRR